MQKLATEPNIASHFNDTDSPLQVWRLINFSGIDSGVTTLMDLTNIELNDCPSVGDYVGLHRDPIGWASLNLSFNRMVIASFLSLVPINGQSELAFLSNNRLKPSSGARR